MRQVTRTPTKPAVSSSRVVGSSLSRTAVRPVAARSISSLRKPPRYYGRKDWDQETSKQSGIPTPQGTWYRQTVTWPLIRGLSRLSSLLARL
uniref:Uncharacterized protein n=1 Tax=Micrococcus phage Kurnik TaxID=3092208 RepID=A0AAU6R664_9CAUD